MLCGYGVYVIGILILVLMLTSALGGILKLSGVWWAYKWWIYAIQYGISVATVLVDYGHCIY